MNQIMLSVTVVEQLVFNRVTDETCYLVTGVVLPFLPFPGLTLRDPEHEWRIKEVVWCRQPGYMLAKLIALEVTGSVIDHAKTLLTPRGWQEVVKKKEHLSLAHERIIKEAFRTMQTAVRDAQGRPIIPGDLS